MPSLILFIGSKNTGPHINAMAYTVDKREVNSFVFVKIINPPIQIEDDFENFFKDKLENDLSNLAKGKYHEQPFHVPTNFYSKVRDHLINNQHREVVNYQSLEESMLQIRDRYGQDSIVDITGMPQRITLHLLLACRSAGFNKVMTFELKRQFSGINALYHNLIEEKDYEYINLLREAKKYDHSTWSNTVSAPNTALPDQPLLSKNLMAPTIFEYGIITIISVCFNLILLFEVVIYTLQWHWLINHPNSYGIQASFDLLLIVFTTGVFLPRYRKWCWGAGAFAIALVLVQILGGPYK